MPSTATTLRRCCAAMLADKGLGDTDTMAAGLPFHFDWP